MPCNQEFAKSQIRRLAGLEFFPQVPEAAAEMLKALMAAPDEVAAERFVSDWLRENDRAPKPSRIYGAFRPEPGALPEYKPATEIACLLCADSGYRIIERGGITAATPCACRRRPTEAA